MLVGNKTRSEPRAKMRVSGDKGYSIKVAGAGAAEILIYEEIGFFGIMASDFVRDLATVPLGTDINVRINSPGGDVFDGLAIYNALKAHPARVNTYIDGLAASMASVIALAGETVTIAENAFVMIHNSMAFVFGNRNDLGQVAGVLEKIDAQVAAMYAAKTGKPVDEIRALMDAETWWTGAEAKAIGYADTLAQVNEPAAAAAAAFDLSVFQNAGQATAALKIAAEKRGTQIAVDAGNALAARNRMRIKLALAEHNEFTS